MTGKTLALMNGEWFFTNFKIFRLYNAEIIFNLICFCVIASVRLQGVHGVAFRGKALLLIIECIILRVILSFFNIVHYHHARTSRMK